MVAQNPGLTMKFREKTDDTVYFDASAKDKQDLLCLIDASIEDLETNRIEVLLHSGADQNILHEMREVIQDSMGDDEPVKMPRSLFMDLGSVASAWKFQGFDLSTPEEQEEFKVSQGTVESLLQIRREIAALG